MADLSEKLGLIVATDLADDLLGPCKMEYAEIVRYFEEDRVETVEAVARWIMGQGYGGDKMTRGEVAELIERDLLAPPSPGESRETAEEDETLIGCQRLGVACGLDFDEEDATLHLRRDDGSEPLEGGRTRIALCGTRVGWDASGGCLNKAPRCGRCFGAAAAEGFGEEVTDGE